MNMLVSNLFELFKLGLRLKVNIWKCRWLNRNTDEKHLAKYYQKALNHLKNKEKPVQALLSEVKVDQEKFHEKKEITNLLTSIVAFLEHLEALRATTHSKHF